MKTYKEKSDKKVRANCKLPKYTGAKEQRCKSPRAALVCARFRFRFRFRFDIRLIFAVPKRGKCTKLQRGPQGSGTRRDQGETDSV